MNKEIYTQSEMWDGALASAPHYCIPVAWLPASVPCQ